MSERVVDAAELRALYGEPNIRAANKRKTPVSFPDRSRHHAFARPSAGLCA